MKPVLVIFASSEGETRRIAEHVVQYLLSRGIAARLQEIEGCDGAIDSSRYQAVVVVASIHVGRHAHEMIRFVRKSRFELAQLPTAFLSVSLAAAAAEDSRQNGAEHPVCLADIESATQDFLNRTAFYPTRILPLAGALLYTQDGQYMRFVIQPIAAEAGQQRDGAREFEYAAWARLDRFIDEFARLHPASTAPALSASPA
jgi:menaquinone-dependent protoporphyrinogen oxidase